MVKAKAHIIFDNTSHWRGYTSGQSTASIISHWKNSGMTTNKCQITPLLSQSIAESRIWRACKIIVVARLLGFTLGELPALAKQGGRIAPYHKRASRALSMWTTYENLEWKTPVPGVATQSRWYWRILSHSCSALQRQRSHAVSCQWTCDFTITIPDAEFRINVAHWYFIVHIKCEIWTSKMRLLSSF